MNASLDCESVGPPERDWYAKIVEAFPRGFSATRRCDGIKVVVIPRMLEVLRVSDAGVPCISLLIPYHGLEWNLLSTSANADGSWTVETDSSGWVELRPITDEEYEAVQQWFHLLDDAWNSLGAERPKVDKEAPVLSGRQDEEDCFPGLQMAEGLFDNEDPMTGEVYPLREPLLVLHCKRPNTMLGLWQISEEQQSSLYPDNEVGRADYEDGRSSLACYKGTQCSWASVVYRITGGMGDGHRWYALANPDHLTLSEMYEKICIDQDDDPSGDETRDGYSGCLERPQYRSEEDE